MTKATLATAGGAVLGSLLNNFTSSQPYNTGVSINGSEIASSKVKSQKISTNYNQTEAEKALLDYTNSNLLKGLENINVFSDDTKRNINKQIEAYKQQGLNTLNEAYTPMFRQLKADIASRFGNLDNSIFMDNLNEIEKNRTKALENLTQEILSKQSELYQNELDNRYNYLNALSITNQNLYSNMLNFLKLASSNVK